MSTVLVQDGFSWGCYGGTVAADGMWSSAEYVHLETRRRVTFVNLIHGPACLWSWTDPLVQWRLRERQLNS